MLCSTALHNFRLHLASASLSPERRFKKRKNRFIYRLTIFIIYCKYVYSCLIIVNVFVVLEVYMVTSPSKHTH